MASRMLEIVHRLRTKFPGVSVLLLQVELPPTFGEPYITRFRKAFGEVVHTTGVTLGPFLLERTAGHSEFNQGDGIHPNARGHELLAETVWPALKPLVVAARANSR